MKPTIVKPNEHDTRESWLRAATGDLRPYFQTCGFPIPDNIRFAIGFPSTGRRGARIGECWHSSTSADLAYEIFIRAALFEPEVSRIDLWHPPASHREGPTFLNVRRILDMPQAVALAFPRPVRLYVKDDAEAAAWEWPLTLQKSLGQEYLRVRRVGE